MEISYVVRPLMLCIFRPCQSLRLIYIMDPALYSGHLIPAPSASVTPTMTGCDPQKDLAFMLQTLRFFGLIYITAALEDCLF